MNETITLKTLAQKRRYAGVMLTYQCTIACRHCLFACRPQNPNVVMSVEDTVNWLRDFSQLDRVVHLSGGEPFMFYPTLIEASRRAGELGVPAHMIETNASWAVSDEIVEKRFLELKETGILGMYFSCDPYHQEFVPIKRLRRAVTIALEIFGEDNITAGMNALNDCSDMITITQDEERLRAHVRAGGARMVGRAFFALAQYLDERPIAALANDGMWGGNSRTENCASAFDPENMWEIHADAYGNIQTNCGVILGNKSKMPTTEILSSEYLQRHPIVSILATEGPTGLIPLAQPKGYQPREKYVQKCAMCFELRNFLRPHYPEYLGPAEIYVD